MSKAKTIPESCELSVVAKDATGVITASKDAVPSAPRKMCPTLELATSAEVSHH